MSSPILFGPNNTANNIQKNLGFNNNSLILATPTIATPYTITLPSAQGGVNTVLTNDGAGNTTWGVQSSTPYFFFGDGSDGTVTLSSGTTFLARNMFYNNLTINGTASLITSGYKIFVLGTLDLTGAAVNSIIVTSAASMNGTAGTGAGVSGTAGAAIAAAADLGPSYVGTNGGAGATTVGVGAGFATANTAANGGNGGTSGAGGSGTSGGGGVGRAGGTNTNFNFRSPSAEFIAKGAVLIGSGAGGTGGGSGSGDGTNKGGGGGGGGAGGGIIWISAFTIATGVSTVANTIISKGGDAGAGGTTTLGNTGGGGGGAGGGGGWIIIRYSIKSGSSVTNLINAAGGAGGAIGSGIGTGTAGGTGSAGFAGTIQVYNFTTLSSVVSVSGALSL